MSYLYTRLAAVALLLVAGCAGGSDREVPQEAARPRAAPLEPAPLSDPAAERPREVKLPGALVNLAEGFVEVEGQVCLREGLLELIATVPAGKEHESLVSLKTRPSSVHAGLVMLGLEPGQPGRWRYEKDKVVAIDPKGSRVRVTLMWQENGAWVEKPIEDFVLDRTGEKHLPGSEFVFAGSRIYQPVDTEGKAAGEPVYLADQTGDVIALVSFDAEVLAWPTAASDSNDNLFWTADPKALPELGTAIKVRMYAVKKETGDRGQGTVDSP